MSSIFFSVRDWNRPSGAPALPVARLGIAPQEAAEEAFDRLTRLATRLLGAPVALVSLVDEERQFFKSQCGLPEPWASQRQTPLSHSFCRHVVERAEPLVVRDAREHPLLRENPAIRDLNIVAYAGMPLIGSDGQVLGSFCAMDTQPRDWSESELAVLRELARSTMTEFELRLRTEQQQRTAQALESSEVLYRQLVESASDIIYRADRRGYFTYANPAALRLTGYGEEEFAGLHFTELVRADHRERLTELYVDQLRRGTSNTYSELPIVTRQGREVWIGQNVQLIREGGVVVGVQAVARDITERCRMEQALQESEARFRATFESAPFGIAVLSPEGRVLQVNAAVERKFGYSRQALENTLLEQLLHPDDRGESEARRHALVAGELRHTLVEHRIRTAGGGYLWVRLGTSVVRGPDGEPQYLIAVGSDVTQQRRDQEALRASEARLRTVVESLGQGLVITDDDDVILYVNTRMTQLTGYTREELLGRVAYGLLFPDQERSRGRAELARRMGGEPGRYELQHLRKDGSRIWLEVSAVPHRGPDGEVVGTLALVEDISERKRAAEVLRQSEERLRLVSRATDDVIWDWDIATDAGYWSDSITRVFGYPPDQVDTSAQWWRDRVHPEDLPQVLAEMERARDEGAELWTGAYRFRRADGTYARVLDRALIMRDPSGTPLRVIGALQDQTEREQAAEALLASEERFRLMVEGSEQVFFYLHDVEHRFEYLSPSVESVLGYPADELVGQPYDVLLAGLETDTAVHETTHSRIVAGEGVSVYTALTRHRDGRVVPIELVESPVVVDGQVVGMQGFARDITERKRAEEALARSEQYFRSLTENAHDVIHVINADRTTRYLSPNAARLLGHDPESLVGRNAEDLIHPDDLPAVVESIRSLRGTHQSRTLEMRVRHQDGSWRTFEGIVRNLLDDPVVAGVVVNSRDVTERKRAEEESLRLAALSRENPNPVLECDAAGRPVHVNPAAERISRDLGVASVRGLLPENHAQLVQGALRSGQGYQNVEVTVGDRIFSWTYRPHVRGNVVHLFAVDITSRRVMEEQLRHDALHDALTGLPNRLLFMERLAHAILRSKRRESYLFAVLFLDLDRFKVINDSLGHHVGDELLVVVARRIKECLRTEDTVARLGGDEFAILLEDIGGASDATRVAERIQAELSAPVNLSGFDVFTSASIGIALSSSAYDRPEYLLRNADMAMYRSKSGGQARFEVFDRAMHANALARLQLETDLRRAIERGEFRLHYQPIVSLDDGRVHGLEALLRWEHPDRGWMQPNDFIPVAEETGMILPLGRWVLDEACRRLRDWQLRLGPAAPATISVNLSAKQFSQADLLDQVRYALDSSSLSPGALRLEITESAVVENADAAVVLLERLKELGVGISLDDFGTGYSSLSYLHRFPLDALKIDRSFVSRMHEGGRSEQLVQTVLALARSLGVAAVAEGVETEDQLAALRALQCGYGQGYLFARPLCPDEVEALLREERVW